MLRLGESCLEAGCRGILANIPYHSLKEYKRSAKALDELEPDFLMLQDWDVDGYGIPVDLISDLFSELETFKCLKIEVVPAESNTQRSMRKPGVHCIFPVDGQSHR